MKEKNVLFGTIAMINALLLFLSIWVYGEQYYHGTHFVVFAAGCANVVLAFRFFRRLKYQGRTVGRIVEKYVDYTYDSVSKRGRKASIVVVNIEYEVDGNKLRNRVKGSYTDYERVRRVGIGYQLQDPSKIIVIGLLSYVQWCIIVVLELVVFIIYILI